MNKDRLLRVVADELDENYKDVKDIIELTFEKIIDCLAEGESVNVVGFGTFEVRKRVARMGRNPQTGERIEIPSTKTPAFRPGRTLRDAVKQSTD